MPGRAGTGFARVTSRAVAVLAALTVAVGVVVGAASPARAEVASPTVVEIPYDVGVHGHPMWDPWFDIGAFGYEAHEYFVSGTATAADADPADYTTRIIVVRPSDPADFSGTVMLDWVNVTAQFENAVDSLTAVRFLLRNGWAWVHVSAQAAGLCCTPLTPQVYDPVRYADLHHPGDAYANDMFSQIAKTFKQPGDVDPMGGLPVDVVLAVGQSQSATRLTDYVKTVQADAGVIDGFLIQANGDKVYDSDPPVPVMHLLGEREADPQDPTVWPNYRLWEVAGAAHADSWIGRQQTEGASTRLAGAGRQSRAMAEALWQSAGNMGETVDPREAVCVVNGALFPTRYAVDAALFHLDRWVRDGTAPPAAPRFAFDDAGALARDTDGNALGGLRLPPIDVPIARYQSALCNLGGITIPFTEAELLQRYGDHQTYYDQMVDATDRAVASGYLLPADADDLLARACAARPRFLDTSTGPCEPSARPATDEPDANSAGPTPGTPHQAASPAPTGTLPATGGGTAIGALVVLALATRRRRTRPPDEMTHRDA